MKHPDPVEFLAEWPADAQISQIHANGRETVNGIFLPPLRVLVRHAQRLVNGSLIATRIGGFGALYLDQPLWQAVANDHGWLDVRGELKKESGEVEWSVNFRISADPDNKGWCANRMSPSIALAWMIASVEEHEHEVRAGMVKQTGGLA